MNETFQMAATLRKEHGRRAMTGVRSGGMVPAILYGHGLKPQSLQVSALDFKRLFEAAGESTLVDLAVDGAAPVKVLIHDIQRNPISHQVTHIDFYQVRMDELITAEVELVFTGVAPAEKEQGGILIKNITHLEIECLPANLPHDLEVDLTILKTFEDVIRVKDLTMPQGVTVLHEAEDAIVSVDEPRSEEELKSLEEAVVENVENVEVAGKKESEDAEAAPEGEAKGGKADKA